MFSIKIERNAENFIKKLDKKEAELILKKLYSIRENPIRFLKKLSGEKLWRLRIKDYRIILDVIVSKKTIIVLRVGFRKNIYD